MTRNIGLLKDKEITEKEIIIMNYTAKSPLRYPGGKSRALKQIIPLIPEFDEFREPMVGGGSVFIAVKNKNPNRKFWINDLNKELSFFWKICKNDSESLVEELQRIKNNDADGKKLYLKFNGEVKYLDNFQRAVRFFLLNRITFSGLAESGGYSDESFRKRFTDSAIIRLANASSVLKNVKVTNYDYEKVIKQDGENVFIFLDPPYPTKAKSKLYGKNGDLHEKFDPIRFAKNMKECKHKWLVTYEDSQQVRDLFSFAYIYPWELQYGMNNYQQKNAAKGKELFISNYKIKILEQTETKY